MQQVKLSMIEFIKYKYNYNYFKIKDITNNLSKGTGQSIIVITKLY